MSSDHGQISEILSFWFDDLPTDRPGSRWFRNPAGEKFDDEIRDRFGGLVDRARETEDLDHWTQSAGGSVALVLLLDQFPRNIYRRSPLSYAADAKARRIAVQTWAHPEDPQFNLQNLPFWHLVFLSLPFQHAEDLALQLLSLQLMDNLILRAKLALADSTAAAERDEQELRDMLQFLELGLSIARRHMECIRRFGRFPGRNRALGRANTEEEEEFLKENPGGF